MAEVQSNIPNQQFPPKISEASCERAVFYCQILESTLPLPILPPEVVVNPKDEPERDTSQGILDLLESLDAGTFIRGQEVGRPTQWCISLQQKVVKENEKELYLTVKCLKLLNKRDEPLWAKMAYEVLDEEGNIIHQSGGVFESEIRPYKDGYFNNLYFGTRQELQQKRDVFIKDGVLRIRVRLNIYKDLAHVSVTGESSSGPPNKRRRMETPMHGLKDAFDSLVNLWETRNESGDVVIKVDGEVIKAHKFILAGRSKVFLNMFNSSTGMKEVKTMELEISDISFQIFQAMVEYLYVNDCLEFDWSNVDHLCAMIYCAQKYAITPLEIRCYSQLMKIMNLENFAKIAKITFLYDCENEFKNEVRHFYESHQVTLNSIESFRKYAHEDFDSFFKLFFHCLSLK